jgi:hypothetical protein
VSAAIVKSDVTDAASELATSAIPTANAWTDILAYVNTFDLTLTGEDAQTDRMAKIYLAAHMATMEKRAASNAAGPMTSESVGGIRRSYGLLAQFASDSSLKSTRYGQLYLEILGASLAGGPMVV